MKQWTVLSIQTYYCYQMKEDKKLMLKQIKVLSLILKKQKSTFYQWRSRVERELVLQPSGLYLQPAEFTVRAAPAQCRGYYWCVSPWNGSGLVLEVNSITPGLCSVNMAQSEADAVGDYLALRWERLGERQRNWTHHSDLHPASWKNGLSSDIKLDFRWHLSLSSRLLSLRCLH